MGVSAVLALSSLQSVAHTVGAKVKKTMRQILEERTASEPDFWQVGKEKYSSLDAVAKAIQEGKLSLPPGSGLRVTKKGWDPEGWDLCRKVRNVSGLTALGGLGTTFAVAATNFIPHPAIFLVPFMVGMLSLSICLGSERAKEHFESAPQIKDSGRVSLGVFQGKPALVYEDMGGEIRKIGDVKS